MMSGNCLPVFRGKMRRWVAVRMGRFRHALENPLEYFAEIPCMSFGSCDYPPLDRTELNAYDPTGPALVEEIWGIGNQ